MIKMSPPQKVDFHISSRRSLSFFLSHPTGACSQTLGPPRGSLCLFCILPSCFFASSVQISPFGTFWKRMGDDGRWKKFQKSQKKRNGKTAPTTAIKATNQIVINPIRDFSNFGRRRFGIEDVEQIADRRSARVHALTKIRSE